MPRKPLVRDDETKTKRTMHSLHSKAPRKAALSAAKLTAAADKARERVSNYSDEQRAELEQRAQRSAGKCRKTHTSRRYLIGARFSPPEAKLVEDAVKRANTDKSKWVRSVLLAAALQ